MSPQSRPLARLRVDCIAGARPNFVKIAPILRALKAKGIAGRLVHTGQHYDQAMERRVLRRTRNSRAGYQSRRRLRARPR